MRCPSATDAYAGPDLNDRPKFNVVIIYEDIAAGKRAKHFYDRVIRELVDECDFRVELWKFGRESRRTGRLRHSLNARKAQLSVRTRDWIERWSGLITDNRSALVALLDQPGIMS